MPRIAFAAEVWLVSYRVLWRAEVSARRTWIEHLDGVAAADCPRNGANLTTSHGLGRAPFDVLATSVGAGAEAGAGLGFGRGEATGADEKSDKEDLFHRGDR